MPASLVDGLPLSTKKPLRVFTPQRSTSVEAKSHSADPLPRHTERSYPWNPAAPICCTPPVNVTPAPSPVNARSDNPDLPHNPMDK